MPHRRLSSGIQALAALLVLAGSPAGQVPLFTFNAPDDCCFRLGSAVGAPGDTNGDGVPDILVGAEFGNIARIYSGHDGELLQELVGDPAGDFFGAAVAGVGDIDGDGLGDVAVGAAANQGRVQVFSGATGDEIHGFMGGPGTVGLGTSVAGLHDVDGDDVPEIAAGASFGNFVRVWSGATGDELFTTVGGRSFDGFGDVMRPAGDIDDDGLDDLLVAAPGGGFARIVSGDGGGIIGTLTGDPEDGFGRMLAGPGDLDGDGRHDLAVGALFGGYVRVYSGEDLSVLYTLRGDFSDVARAGDWDGDGLPDLLVVDSGAREVRVLRGHDGQPITTIPNDPNLTSASVAAGVGDLDGDGVPEAVVGAPFAVNTAGQARVYALGRSPWSDLGFQLGFFPVLQGSGALRAGEPTFLDIVMVFAESPGFLVLSLRRADIPFQGGVLVPAPDIVVVVVPSFWGNAQVPFSWPALPAGTEIFIQFWSESPYAGQETWQATNAIAGTSAG